MLLFLAVYPLGIGVSSRSRLLFGITEAEREYLRSLRTQAESLRKLRAHMMDDGVITAGELELLIASLDQAARGLSMQHQRLIAEGLHQKSQRGRARYAAKLMNRAGIGSGALPVAAP